MPTLSLSKSSHSGRVSSEALGLARIYRNKIGESTVAAKAEIERLLAPIRPRDNFQPMPRHQFLQYIVGRWKKLPEIGQLQTLAEFADGKMRLAELRATPTKLRFASWSEADWESSVSISSTVCLCMPPMFAFERRDLICFGMHSLARWWERTPSSRSDADLVRDMMEAVQYDTLGRVDFEIPLHSGFSWVGETISHQGKPLLLVRTFR